MTEPVLTFPSPQHDPDDADLREDPAPQERRLALIEAIIFAAEEPPTIEQIAAGVGVPLEVARADIHALCEAYRSDARGIEVRAVGGGYRMSTKPEHHEGVKAFTKSIQPRLKLSMAALETLAVVAYRQPVTLPEIQAIRGVVSAGGVIHTLLKHKLVATAGRKKVIGRPIRYKTTKEFLDHFGLNDLEDLPNHKEIEALSRAALEEDFGVADAAVGDTGKEGPQSETESGAGPGAAD